MAITEGAVSEMDGDTATDGAVIALSSILHPLQGNVVVLFVGNMVGLCGKARAPHLWQHIKVAAWMLSYHALCLKNILVSLCPLDVRL